MHLQIICERDIQAKTFEKKTKKEALGITKVAEEKENDHNACDCL